MDKSLYLSAYKRFHAIDPLKFIEDRMGRIPYNEVADKLKELKVSGGGGGGGGGGVGDQTRNRRWGGRVGTQTAHIYMV